MVPRGTPRQAVTPLPASDAEHLTDRLLNKMEKEQTTFDVQIGDGMDIGIMGENGEHALSFMEVFVVVISFSFQMFTY